MMTDEIDIWPNSRFSINPRALTSASIADIELFLKAKYPSTFPVLFSSARAGIYSILKMLGAKRSDLIWLPPFSSHCVLNTVSFLATPTTTDLLNSNFTLIYHQWGFPTVLPVSKPNLLEDSVDSLCTHESALFPNNGRFEILSFAKIFGSHFGGSILCRTKEDAEQLRAVRDSNINFGITHSLRKVFHNVAKRQLYYWGNSEPLNGGISKIMCFDIAASLQDWDQVISDRKAKIKLMHTFSVRAVQKQSSRLPACIPVAYTSANVDLLKKLELYTGVRTMISFKKDEIILESVLPVPIHSQIPISLIQSLSLSLNNIPKTHQ